MRDFLPYCQHYVKGFVLPSTSEAEILRSINIWTGSTAAEIFDVIARQKLQHVPDHCRIHYQARIEETLKDLTIKGLVEVVNPMEDWEMQARRNHDENWTHVPRYKKTRGDSSSTPIKEMTAVVAVNA